MKQVVKLLMPIGMIFLMASVASALELVNEWRVESVNGGQVKEELRFWSQGYEDFVLSVQNGNEDASERASSAIINLNGVTVLKPSDFNQKASELSRAIVPQEGENVLSVNVRSNPGSFLVIQVFGEPTLNLPPDPGPAGDATIEGVDVNENGVRDDIERWIGLNFRDSEKTRMALTQAYYANQNFMIHASDGDRDAVYNDMDVLGRASECLFYVRREDAKDLLSELHARVVNTTERFDADREASRMLGGGTFSSKPISKWKDSCTFDPDALID